MVDMNKEQLYRFFKGEASLKEEMRIRKWMETSSGNRRMFFEERKLFDMMTLFADEKAAGKPAARRPFRLRVIRELARIAAVVAILLAGHYLYDRPFGAGEPDAMQIIHVPAGQRVNITLPDGSNVWLNARSRLKYPVSFNGRERLMELDGEAYFSVAGNKSKPFVVKTAQGTIEVTGTDFNVDAYSFRNVFETTLMKGQVKISLNDRPEEEAVWLTPDRKAVLREGKLHIEQVDDYTPYRWREGLICFTDKSFSSIMNDFEKYYGVTIQVKNQKALKAFYTGKFRYTDGIDYALRVLQKDIPFRYSRNDENQQIYIE
jgi:ferric-dicitrate binding protein FerR (iron transport regulator)